MKQVNTLNSYSLRLPYKKDKKGNVLELIWSEGPTTIISAEKLRQACPCASCRTTKIKILPEVEILEIYPVGRYALNFLFSDNHNLGIYTYAYLRSLDESQDGI
ncbi:MAG: DUF971 domain-containing protein [Leptospiraceae bacterium]|nr:DUF971 domain-containing protein [Leptospiraceae bacterium]MDW8306019.1 DUF971 domain-containing protein [Leptospiraceae bacterium]